MKTSRFSDSQILAILKQAENGVPVTELCREHGMSSATFYKWRSKFGGMDASLMARMKELERENAQLKRMKRQTDKQQICKAGQMLAGYGAERYSGIDRFRHSQAS